MIDGKPEMFAVYWTTEKGDPSMQLAFRFKDASEIRKTLTRPMDAEDTKDLAFSFKVTLPRAKAGTPVRVARFVGEWL